VKRSSLKVILLKADFISEIQGATVKFIILDVVNASCKRKGIKVSFIAEGYCIKNSTARFPVV